MQSELQKAFLEFWLGLLTSFFLTITITPSMLHTHIHTHMMMIALSSQMIAFSWFSCIDTFSSTVSSPMIFQFSSSLANLEAEMTEWWLQLEKVLVYTMYLIKLEKALQNLLQIMQVVSLYLKGSVSYSHLLWNFMWWTYPALERRIQSQILYFQTFSWTWKSDIIPFVSCNINHLWFSFLYSKEACPFLNVFFYSDLLNVSFSQPRISIFCVLRIFLMLYL